MLESKLPPFRGLVTPMLRLSTLQDGLNTLKTAQAVLDARPGLVSNASAPELLSETLSLLADFLKPDLDATQDGGKADSQVTTLHAIDVSQSSDHSHR